MMNAKNRRAYLERMRKDQAACFCPGCKRKTRHYTVPCSGDDGACDIVCEMCNKAVKSHVRGLQPYSFVKIFD